MNIKTLALIAAFASISAPFAIHAADAPAADAPRRGGFRQPGLQDLSADEQAKYKAARETAQKDPKVVAAMEKVTAALKESREALNAAIVAADPSLESVVKKLQEASDKARAERANRPAN